MRARGPSRIRTGDGGFAIRCHQSTTKYKTNELGQSTVREVPALVPSPSDVTSHTNLSPELTRIIHAWPILPAVVRAGILAMIEASEGTDGQNVHRGRL